MNTTELDRLIREDYEALERRARLWWPTDPGGLIHEAYLKIRAHVPKLESRVNMRAFFYRSLFNLAMDWRRRRVREVTGVDIEPAVDPIDPTFESEAEEYNPTSEELADAIEKLPESLRMVVKLRQQGLTNPQIADALGITPNAAALRYHRAIKKLRDILEASRRLKERASSVERRKQNIN